jgi:hypothetical protein
MRGKLPEGGEFGSWLREVRVGQTGKIISFDVVQNRPDMLIDAARFISLVVAPGRNYDVPPSNTPVLERPAHSSR